MNQKSPAPAGLFTERIFAMRTEAQKKADAKYKAAHTVRLVIDLYKSTDSEIIEKLGSVESKAGYIKQLIREDLKKV